MRKIIVLGTFAALAFACRADRPVSQIPDPYLEETPEQINEEAEELEPVDDRAEERAEELEEQGEEMEEEAEELD